jgi:hypothetical protein
MASPATIINDVAEMDKNGSVEKVRIMQKVAESHAQRPFYPQVAVLTNKLHALDLLLKAGVPIEEDQQGKTPLDYALEENNAGAISFLVQYPAARACNLNALLENKSTSNTSNKEQLDFESAKPRLLQSVINQNLLYMPTKINAKFDISTGACKDLKLAQSCEALEKAITLASESKITMSDESYQKATRIVFLYHMSAYLSCHYHSTGYNTRQSALKNLIPKHIASLQGDKNLLWHTYAAALHKGYRGNWELLNTLQKHVAIDPVKEWNTIVLPPRTADHTQSLLAQVYTTLKLRPQFSIDEKTANALDDVADTYICYLSKDVRDLLYDHTSADRHTFRPVNLFYRIRQCQRSQATDDAPASSSSASATQSGQADAANDDDKKDK